MNFCKIFRRDLLGGLHYNGKRLLFFGALVVFLCVNMILYMGTEAHAEGIDVGGTFMDRLEPFLIPVRWFAVHSAGLYVVLVYAREDLECSGKQFLLRSRNREIYWLSKVLWNCLQVLLCYAIIYGITFSVVLFNGDRFSMKATEKYLFMLMEGEAVNHSYDAELIPAVIVLPVLFSMFFCQLQMVLEYMCKPSVAYLVSAGLLIMSVYLPAKGLPGQYLIPLRSRAVCENGYYFLNGFLWWLFLMAAVLIFGCVRIRRKDVM